RPLQVFLGVMSGFGLNSWTTGEATDALTDIRVAGAVGYQFIELRDWKIQQHLAQGGTLAALREQAEQARISVLSVNTLDDSTLPLGPTQQTLIDRCHQLCSWASDLACPHVIVGPSYQTDPPIEGSLVHSRTVEALQRYARVGADHAVNICFEFH